MTSKLMNLKTIRAGLAAAACFAVMAPATAQPANTNVRPGQFDARDKVAQRQRAVQQNQVEGVPEQSKGRLDFAKIHHDFGDIPANTTDEHAFTFTNTGDEAVYIYRTRTSCGCTVAALEKNEYMPGESGKIIARFSPKGTSRQSKSVFVMTNAVGQEQLELKVSAQPILTYQWQPRNVQMGEVKVGNAKTQQVFIRSRDPQFTVENVRVEDFDDVIIRELGEDEFDASVVADGNLKYVKGFEITLADNAPIGRQVRRFAADVVSRLNPDEQPEPVKEQVNVFATVVGDLRVTPPGIRIAPKQRNEDFEATVRVESRSGTPFEISGAEVVRSSLPGITTDVAPVEGTETEGGATAYLVTIKGNTGAFRGQFRGHMVIRTNVDRETEQTVNFTGNVRISAARRSGGSGNANVVRR
ncbi:MAG: DUF1573 domain-containing protein [Planctomycetota bacterium]